MSKPELNYKLDVIDCPVCGAICNADPGIHTTCKLESEIDRLAAEVARLKGLVREGLELMSDWNPEAKHKWKARTRQALEDNHE